MSSYSIVLAAIGFLGLIANLMIFWFKKEDMNPYQMINLLSYQLFGFVIVITVLSIYLSKQGII